MLSQIAQKHADACRFCWMCRHLCPVGLQTGKEANTPRAKGLQLSLTQRGSASFDANMAEGMYECLLCDACTNDCVTGFEPPLYIREARTQAMVEDIAPAPVVQVLDNIERTGNIYGEEKPTFPSKDNAEVLLYVGEVAACRVPQLAEAYMRLLDKAGISYMTLEQEPPSGAMLGDLIGFTQEVQDQGAACVKALDASGADTVIVLDSYDAAVMRQRWPEWGLSAKAQIITATAFLDQLVQEGKLKLRSLNQTATYHDDSRAARTLQEFEPPRALLAAAGIALSEMFLHRDLAKCCGSSLANAYMPQITLLTAQGRWHDALRTQAQLLVTTCPQSMELLGRAVPQDMELIDLYTLLERACE